MVRKKKLKQPPCLDWVPIIREHGRLLIFPFEELNQYPCFFEQGLTDSSFDLLNVDPMNPIDYRSYRRRAGVYLPYAGKHLMYIGASGHIFGRLASHSLRLQFLRTKKNLGVETKVLLVILEGFEHPYQTPTHQVRHPAFILERLLIKYFKPKFNAVGRYSAYGECDPKSENFDAEIMTIDGLIDIALSMI